MRRKFLILSFLGASFWILILHQFGSLHHTFQKKWQDNVSNFSAVQLFRFENFSVHQFPVGSLVSPLAIEEVHPNFLTDTEETQWFTHPQLSEKQPLFFVWPEVPRPYPLGAWLTYAPFSMAVYQGGLAMHWGTFFSSWFFLFVAHLCFFLFFLSMKDLGIPKWMFGAFLFVLYGELIYWSGQGQYDLIAMIPLILSYRAVKEGQFQKSLVLYLLAFNFHFRALFSIGLFFAATFQSLRRWTWTWKSLGAYGLCLVLGLLGSYVLFLNREFITSGEIYKLNEYHFSTLLEKSWFEVLGFVFSFVFVLGYFGLKRQWLLFFVAAGNFFVLFTSPQLREWYVMFVFPIFLAIPSRHRHVRGLFICCVIFYTLLAMFFLKRSPFELGFLRELFEVIFLGRNEG